MGLWCWSVQQASEHTPGPWAAEHEEGSADHPLEVWAVLKGLPWQKVAGVATTPRKVIGNTQLKLFEQDQEAHANALLMADAPAMLLLLAKVAERIEATERRPVPNGEAWAKLYAEVCDLLRRHVRLDVGGIPDSEHTPAKGERGGQHDPVPL